MENRKKIKNYKLQIHTSTNNIKRKLHEREEEKNYRIILSSRHCNGHAVHIYKMYLLINISISFLFFDRLIFNSS